jgi:predicted enzyme related to lactoylglutathione lyase
MAATIRHFAINADDMPRAKAFYETVFGWELTPWGPPDFYQAYNAGPPGVMGALQGRREIDPGVRIRGPEVTLAVDDIEATMKAIVRAGGRLLSQPFNIHGVGVLVWFNDSEGNLLGAMQYEAAARGP